MNKLKQWIGQNRRWIYTVLIIVFAAASVFVLNQSIKANKPLKVVYSIKNHNVLGEDTIQYYQLTKDTVLSQEIPADNDFDGFSLSFHSENAELAGHTYLKMTRQDTGEVVYEDVIENQQLKLDQTVSFYMDLDKRGKEDVMYLLEITSDTEDEANAVSIYLQNYGYYIGFLRVNDTIYREGVVCFGAFQYTNKPASLYHKILLMAVAVFAVVCIVMVGMKLSLHKVIFVALLGFGMMYMIVIPPGKICDANTHYLTTYQLSNQILGVQSPDGGHVSMRAEDYKVFRKCFNVVDAYYNNLSADAYLDMADYFTVFAEHPEVVSTMMKPDDIVSIPYLPFALGLSAARILHLGAVPALYLSRVFALLLFAVMIAWAVKVAPVGKEIIGLVALLPMSMQQLVSFSYDGMCIAAALLFTAYWLSYLYADRSTLSRKAEIRDYVIMLVLGALIGASKNGLYLFIGLLLLSVTNGQLSRKRKVWIAAAIIGSALLFNVVKYLGVSAEATGTVAMAADASKYNNDGSYTLGYGAAHPISFLLMVIGALMENGDYYIGSILGTHMGENLPVVPLAVVLPFLFLLIGVSLKEENHMLSTDTIASSESIVLDRRSKGVAAVVLILVFLLTFFMMQVSTPIGWNIAGVSGRYFLPVLPLVFLLLRSRTLTIRRSVKPKLVLAFCYWEVIELLYIIWFGFSR